VDTATKDVVKLSSRTLYSCTKHATIRNATSRTDIMELTGASTDAPNHNQLIKCATPSAIMKVAIGITEYVLVISSVIQINCVI